MVLLPPLSMTMPSFKIINPEHEPKNNLSVRARWNLRIVWETDSMGLSRIPKDPPTGHILLRFSWGGNLFQAIPEFPSILESTFFIDR
jgi:hypothetical protein